jgi:GrpB-like predicted nucleotidyltransferase (UPF0157 family)
MAQHIVVREYDPFWQDAFEVESALIQKILGENLVAIHHIGSTSVPGLAAKPIIDILPVVRCLEQVDAVRGGFEQIGYEFLGEFGIPGRRYLRKGGAERTHQIHIFSQESQHDIQRHLAVRDYLRAHPFARDAYAALKRRLAEQYPYDIEGYCDGKNDFVKELERTALKWKQGEGKDEWNLVRSQEDIDQLMHLSGGFHDCCIVSMEYRSGNCTDSQGSMHFGDADQHEVVLLLHSQWIPPVELCFTGVRQLHLTGWQKDYTSEITDAHLSFSDQLLPGRVILWAGSDCFDPTALPHTLREPSVSYIAADALRWRILR